MSSDFPNPAPGGPARGVSRTHGGPRAWLRGALTLGLLSTLGGPPAVPNQISQAERALLGRTGTPLPAAGGPVETASPSITDGAAALLNDRGAVVRLAGGSSVSGNRVDGERALLNRTATYDQGPGGGAVDDGR